MVTAQLQVISIKQSRIVILHTPRGQDYCLVANKKEMHQQYTL